MFQFALTRRQFGAVSAFATLSASGLAQAAPEPPKIVKLGTIDLDLVETTPIVLCAGAGLLALLLLTGALGRRRLGSVRKALVAEATKGGGEGRWVG